jgi:hypothetical protein
MLNLSFIFTYFDFSELPINETLKVRKLLSLFFFAYMAKQEKAGKEDPLRLPTGFRSKTFSCQVDFKEIEIHILKRLKAAS